MHQTINTIKTTGAIYIHICVPPLLRSRDSVHLAVALCTMVFLNTAKSSIIRKNRDKIVIIEDKNGIHIEYKVIVLITRCILAKPTEMRTLCPGTLFDPCPIIVGGLKCGMDVSIACPASYQPHPDVLAYAETVTDAKFVMTQDPMEAAKDADVIFTDVWASMGQEQEKAQREQAFAGFQVNSEMMKVAKPDCMIQHCLPAHRGEEITEEVFEGHAQEIFDEAENRLHAQKAVMALLMG